MRKVFLEMSGICKQNVFWEYSLYFRSILIIACLIYSPRICFYDKYKDSFKHVRVLINIWYEETVYKRKNVNLGPRSNFLAECVPRPIKFGQPCSTKLLLTPNLSLYFNNSRTLSILKCKKWSVQESGSNRAAALACGERHSQTPCISENIILI